jgi:hypothetical protein
MLIVEHNDLCFADSGQVRYFSIARYALIEALRLAGIGVGSRVLLPSFICRDLLAPLFALGAEPCWYDVSPNMAPLTSSDTWPLADVVVAVNYFGFPQDLHAFELYAQRACAVIIEDNAHGYLSQDASGRWLGCRTELGLFSLRKTLRIPDGAALWVSSQRDINTLKQLPFDGKGLSSLQLIKLRIRTFPLFGEVVYKISTKLIRFLRKLRSGRDRPFADPESERELTVSPNPWSKLLRALGDVNVSSEVARRRKAYDQCAVIGDKIGVAPIFSVVPPNCAPYAYAFRGNVSQVAEMRNFAENYGFDMVSWPDLPEEISGQAPAYYRDVFLINLMW